MHIKPHVIGIKILSSRVFPRSLAKYHLFYEQYIYSIADSDSADVRSGADASGKGFPARPEKRQGGDCRTARTVGGAPSDCMGAGSSS